jgi:hypothetical protein
MATRSFTVACAEHGEMARDEPRCGWVCTDGTCKAWLPDEKVRRLVFAAPVGSPDPLPLVVT